MNQEALDDALLHAVKYDDLKEVARLLEDGAEPYAADSFWSPPERTYLSAHSFDHAAMRGHVKCLEMLCAARGMDAGDLPKSCLSHAILYFQKDVLSWMAQHGFDMNGIIAGGASPLLSAILHDSKYPTADRSRVAMLLEVGASPDSADESDQSALHYTARQKMPEAMQRLIRAGADIKAVYNGQTPLGMLCLSTFTERTAQCVDLLVAAGADVCGALFNQLGEFRRISTPMPFVLVEQGRADILNHLLKTKAFDANLTVPAGCKLPEGMPLLYHAVDHASAIMVALLTQHGAEAHPAWRDSRGATLLTWALKGESFNHALSDALGKAGADFFGPIRPERSDLNSFFTLSSHVEKDHLLERQAEMRHTLAHWVEEGACVERLVEQGKPTPLLLESCAYGLMPLFASPEFWGEHAPKAYKAWQEIRHALPQHWRIQMDMQDVTALKALDETKTAETFFRKQVRPNPLKTGQQR